MNLKAQIHKLNLIERKTSLKNASYPFSVQGDNATISYLPYQSFNWYDFTKNMPKGSIGLDGFVRDKTILLDSNFPLYLNFDHHIGDRTLIRSTCSQVFHYAQGKVFSSCFEKYNIKPVAYINHLDGDSVLSAYIVANYSKYESDHAKDLPIRKIIDIEDEIDRNGGIFHGNLNDKFFHYLNWCLQPLDSALSPDIKLTSCFERFSDFENGKGKMLQPQSAFCFIQDFYPTTQESPYFHFITAESPFTRSFLFQGGEKDAFVSLKEISTKDNQEECFTYSIGKLTETSNFPIKDIVTILNYVEKILQPNLITKNNCWGTNNLIGGSPYKTQSKITPNLLTKIIDEFINFRVQNGKNQTDEFYISILPTLMQEFLENSHEIPYETQHFKFF